MTTATFLTINNAKAIACHTMKKTWLQGGQTYVEKAYFTEYDNGVILVLPPSLENGLYTKEEARSIAAELQAKGFKFI
jgi:hypothetical protein